MVVGVAQVVVVHPAAAVAVGWRPVAIMVVIVVAAEEVAQAAVGILENKERKFRKKDYFILFSPHRWISRPAVCDGGGESEGNVQGRRWLAVAVVVVGVGVAFETLQSPTSKR